MHNGIEETPRKETDAARTEKLTEEGRLNERESARADGSENASQQIARATGIVMFAFILSSLVGVVHQVVITNAFGTSAALDSFNAANRVTELLFNLVAGGALGSAFIPIFTGFLTRGDKRGAWRLASGVVNIVFLVLIAVSVLSWIFAPWI
ncbi:MAG: lipid II flippase MurJ, partial [Anaerolineaceae bacterium]